jgi:hypothetical protein
VLHINVLAANLLGDVDARDTGGDQAVLRDWLLRGFASHLDVELSVTDEIGRSSILSRPRRDCTSDVGLPARFGLERSLPMLEPVSVRGREFRGEKVWRGQRLGGLFWRHLSIPGGRARDAASPAAKPRKVKDYSPAPGNRNRAGVRGGARRTRTSNRAIMRYSEWRIAFFDACISEPPIARDHIYAFGAHGHDRTIGPALVPAM